MTRHPDLKLYLYPNNIYIKNIDTYYINRITIYYLLMVSVVVIWNEIYFNIFTVNQNKTIHSYVQFIP